MKKMAALFLVFFMLVGLSGCGKSEAVKKTEELIMNIGEIDLESKQAIQDARDLYNSLSDAEKNSVENVDLLKDAETAYHTIETAFNAYKHINNAYSIVDEMGQEVYNAWHTGIFEKSNISAEKIAEGSMMSYNDVILGVAFVSWKYSCLLTGTASNEEEVTFEVWEEQDDAIKAEWIEHPDVIFQLVSLGFVSGGYEPVCCEAVRSAYRLNGRKSEIEAEMEEAKNELKELENDNSSYKYLANIKNYYNATVSLLEFCEEPKGTILQFSDTLNEYRNQARENAIELELAFE